MSLSERPQAWCTPIGLLAVIGPSRKDQRGPSFVWARSLSKMRRSAQKRRISRSRAGKSGIRGTGRYTRASVAGEFSIAASSGLEAPRVGAEGRDEIRRGDGERQRAPAPHQGAVPEDVGQA